MLEEPKPKMMVKSRHNLNIWEESLDPSLVYISKESNIPDKWIRFDDIKNGEYGDSIIKPVNKYVEQMGIPPTLVSIDGNTVRLRQGNFAEIYLLVEEAGFYNSDRPHMRQYYKSADTTMPPADCFPESYVFFVPWAIDADVEVRFEQPGIESPVTIYESEFKYRKIANDAQYIDPPLVKFHFNRSGKHMQMPILGKIRINSPIFDMVFQADDIIIERVRSFYATKKEK